MFLQMCVCPQGGIPECIAGGIPVCLAAGLWGEVSQHALQVSRPTPKWEVEGDLARGVSRPTPKGEVEGDQAGGVSRPTPKGEVEGIWPGGLRAHTQGGCLLWGVPALGGTCSGGCLLQEGCLLRGLPAPGGVETPPRDGYCCGNAFLFLFQFTRILLTPSLLLTLTNI